ncbi:hypothetical protein [Pseudomonas sp.]|uniref:hypothetical protein n=1 Tax=Pseudomonas sp. TaxID=306 RepID=UPI0028AE86DF|nr:hypothetical protein [Pseudomonas sp.]
MSKRFGNKRAAGFIKDLATESVESSGLIKKLKFNLHYLDLEQPAGLKGEISLDFMKLLLDKLKNFSEESLAHWVTMPAGRGNGNIYQVYDRFPSKSEFKHPSSVPHDAVWGRFRIDRTIRLAGFTVPSNLNHKLCEKEKFRYCTNTFYVVFIDLHHKFYAT